MATEILAGQVGEIRAASTAAGGHALSNAVGGTSTAASGFIQLPTGTYHVYLTPRNFSTAVVVKFSFNPYLIVLKTIDNMVTAPTDYSLNAQDASTSTLVTISSLDTLANGDFLLIGSHLPFRGVYVDVYGTNGAGTATTSVYYNASGTWTDTGATDGTNASRTFAQDGLVYWDVPAGWTPARLKALYPHMPDSDLANLNYFWTRWSVSAVLADTDVTFYSMVAANRSTTYAELVSGQTFEERITTGVQGGIGCIEALTDAGTANLIVNVATVRDGRFS